MDFSPAEDALLDCYERVVELLKEEAYDDLPSAELLVEGVNRRVEREIQESYRKRSLEELDVVSLFQQALGALRLDLPTDLIRRIATMEHRAMASRMMVPKENLAVLANLRQRGLRIGLVSNAHFLPEMMREDIERLGVAVYIDDAVFSSEIRVRKPHPEIFMKVLTAIGTEPHAALFVGDRLADDIAGAQAVGMRTVLTTQYRQEDPAAGDVVPDYTIATLAELVHGATERGPARTRLPGRARSQQRLHRPRETSRCRLRSEIRGFEPRCSESLRRVCGRTESRKRLPADSLFRTPDR
jgi:HAD superfamily hydrolase (TIGR01509 family)